MNAFRFVPYLLAPHARYEELVFRDRLMSILDNHDTSTPLFLLYAPKIAHYPIQAPQEYVPAFANHNRTRYTEAEPFTKAQW